MMKMVKNSARNALSTWINGLLEIFRISFRTLRGESDAGNFVTILRATAKQEEPYLEYHSRC